MKIKKNNHFSSQNFSACIKADDAIKWFPSLKSKEFLELFQHGFAVAKSIFSHNQILYRLINIKYFNHYNSDKKM